MAKQQEGFNTDIIEHIEKPLAQLFTESNADRVIKIGKVRHVFITYQNYLDPLF